MSDPSDQPGKPGPQAPDTRSSPAPGRIQRGRIGVNVFVQTFLALILWAMANYLGARHFKQWDRSYSRSFTLAPGTISFLQKTTLPLRITVLTERGGDVEKDTASLLEQYEQQLKERLDFEIIDTRLASEQWTAFQARHYKSNLDLKRSGILLETPSTTPGAPPSMQFIGEEALYDVEPVKKSRLAYKGESLINSAIRSLASPERPAVAVVSGLSPKRFSSEGKTMLDTLADIGARQNFELVSWQVLVKEAAADGDHYRCALLVGTSDFGPQQDELLTRYLEKPGNGLMVMLDPNNDTPALDAFLTRYGIKPEQNRVLMARATGTTPEKYMGATDAIFTEGNQVNQGIEGSVTILLGQTKSITLLSGLEKQKSENITLQSLLTPTSQFWGEVDWRDELPTPDKGKDAVYPFSVAVAMERGAAVDTRVQLGSSRLVVVGNSQMADWPASDVNYDFITRSINWLLHRDVTTTNDSTTDRSKHMFSLKVSSDQSRRLFYITTLVLPLAALVAGFVVWSTRRH